MKISHNNIDEIKNYLLSLQNEICLSIQNEEDKATFNEDKWVHTGGGGGITRILSNGNTIEKGGVNFSHVFGASLPKAATLKRPELVDASFQALGVSVVMHPLNPYVPTSHFNVRAIIVEKKDQTFHWWFGGGFDLTPYYGFVEDAKHWHQMAKAACDPYGAEVYSNYKRWADEYFFLAHRNEPRGIGGIFFDDLNAWSFSQCFSFMRSVGEHYIKAYQPILHLRKTQTFGEKELNFQAYRRGRYVEFNLLYDRGTLFGLQSGGRTESILMSLPPRVAWQYQYYPEVGSKEEELYHHFLVPRDWV